MEHRHHPREVQTDRQRCENHLSLSSGSTTTITTTITTTTTTTWWHRRCGRRLRRIITLLHGNSALVNECMYVWKYDSNFFGTNQGKVIDGPPTLRVFVLRLRSRRRFYGCLWCAVIFGDGVVNKKKLGCGVANWWQWAIFFFFLTLSQ